jgi:hypothetical protein
MKKKKKKQKQKTMLIEGSEASPTS